MSNVWINIKQRHIYMYTMRMHRHAHSHIHQTTNTIMHMQTATSPRLHYIKTLHTAEKKYCKENKGKNLFAINKQLCVCMSLCCLSPHFLQCVFAFPCQSFLIIVYTHPTQLWLLPLYFRYTYICMWVWVCVGGCVCVSVVCELRYEI